MNDWSRLPVIALLFMFLSRIKEFIVPLIISLFAGGTNPTMTFTRWLFPFLITILLLHSVFYWLFFRYRLDDHQLIVKQGVFIKKNRYIKKERVQSVDMTSSVLHRLFRVGKLSIETAGGGLEAEAVFPAIGQGEAEKIRRYFHDENFLQKSEEDGEEGREEWTYRVPTKNIFLAGLTSGKIGIVVSAGAAFLTQVDQFISDDFYERTAGMMMALGMTLILVIALFLLLITWLVSVLLTVIKYGNFTITKRENKITITRGLLEKRELTLSLERVTSVRYLTHPLRQIFGWWSIYVDSAGGGKEEEMLSTLLLPLGSKEEAQTLMRQLIPEATMPETIVRLPKRARKRYIFRTSIISWLLVPIAFWLPNGYFYIVVPFLFMYLGYRRYKDSGYELFNDRAVVQNRNFQLSVSILPRRYIQSMSLSQTFFQKRKELYTLEMRILTSSGGRMFRLKDMERIPAKDPFQWYRKKQ